MHAQKPGFCVPLLGLAYMCCTADLRSGAAGGSALCTGSSRDCCFTGSFVNGASDGGPRPGMAVLRIGKTSKDAAVGVLDVRAGRANPGGLYVTAVAVGVQLKGCRLDASPLAVSGAPKDGVSAGRHHRDICCQRAVWQAPLSANEAAATGVRICLGSRQRTYCQLALTCRRQEGCKRGQRLLFVRRVRGHTASTAENTALGVPGITWPTIVDGSGSLCSVPARNLYAETYLGRLARLSKVAVPPGVSA